MKVPGLRRGVFATACCAGALSAQNTVPELFLAPDLIVQKSVVNTQLQWQPKQLIVMPDGRMVMQSKVNGSIGALSVTGAPLNWKLSIGWRGDNDFVWVERLGSSGDRTWVVDGNTKQIGFLDAQGKNVDAIPYPSWVHPHWADRHTYPLFGYMNPWAVYPNGDLLVQPYAPRTLFDTKGFDRSLVHLLRITKDGAIEKEVAQLPSERDFVTMRTENNVRNIEVPYAAKWFWRAAGDGSRVVIVAPDITAANNGSFAITALGENGDTVFTKRFPMPSVRVPKASVDSALGKIEAYGNETAQQIRERVAKRIPEFRSYIADVFLGHDRSTWVIQRPLADTAKARTALVIDERGEAIARVALSDTLSILAVDRDHLWAATKHLPVLVRFKLQATKPPVTPVPPPRTATASKGKG